jgi:hypothetical protein
MVLVNGGINKMIIAANRASTPPNLFGIDRRIAYIHRKYHSGLIWMGVTNGFALKKFSGSVNKLGSNSTIRDSPEIASMYPNASLIE